MSLASRRELADHPDRGDIGIMTKLPDIDELDRLHAEGEGRRKEQAEAKDLAQQQLRAEVRKMKEAQLEDFATKVLASIPDLVRLAAGQGYKAVTVARFLPGRSTSEPDEETHILDRVREYVRPEPRYRVVVWCPDMPGRPRGVNVVQPQSGALTVDASESLSGKDRFEARVYIPKDTKASPGSFSEVGAAGYIIVSWDPSLPASS
jgi:hypothetical protein